jgi:prepilin-type N-terminal cleavage/methylation domain-containing protein
MPKVKKIIDLVFLCPGGRKKMRKAFTLIELAVAVGLLAMMISFASLIFDMSIDTHRMAMANAEIMQKLQAITGQLNADFKGMRWEAGGRISFIPSGLGVRADRIAFFTNGDFQSTGQYETNADSGKTVVGNIAGVFYGLADANATDPREKILVRRQTILTSDSSLTQSFDLINRQEYCDKQTLADVVVDPCLVNDLMEGSDWDPNSQDPDVLVMYLADGVDYFTIQFAYWDGSGKLEWLPKKDELDFGEYDRISTSAFKFTFTLYDSKGVLKDGKTFTHIVYLGD